MPQTKKLQVFISSTYKDLLKERQAAVEAILQAGHIPAGMELFAAGDESQMTVIKRWIDNSDVFFLMLGGRYGSIESQSGKSYVQLEYEYANERRKPIFAVVINEAYLRQKKAESLDPDLIEIEHCENLGQFRQMVESDKVVGFWSEPSDIERAVFTSLEEFSQRDDIPGWVHGCEAQDMAAELTHLTKENSELKQGLPWLFRDADLMAVEATVPANSSVWVITPDLFHVTQQMNMRGVVRQNAARGVTYTYIYPRGRINARYEPALENLFSGAEARLTRQPVTGARFSSLAITHYRILNPDSIDDSSCAFLELPIPSRGYWIKVDSNGVKGLVDRFDETAKRKRPL
jgi:hypothetical protein